MDETLFLKCIIDENRRAIVRQLEGVEMAAGEIAERLGMEHRAKGQVGLLQDVRSPHPSAHGTAQRRFRVHRSMRV